MKINPVLIVHVLVLVTLTLLITLPASAQDYGQHNRKIEIWECFGYSDRNKTTILTLTRFDNGTGAVDAGGPTTYTEFRMAGLNRRWNWEEQGRGWRYSIILTLERTARYYDFSGVDSGEKTKPQEIFKCEML